MNLLQRILDISPARPESGMDLLEIAESIGTVEVSDHFGHKRASIAIGQWGVQQLRVWGDGITTKQALAVAIGKAQLLLSKLGD